MFPAPSVEVRGRGRSDQVWINDTVESGVAACHWPRPKARLVAKRNDQFRKNAKATIKPKIARKPKKSGSTWVDAIQPVPVLPEPEPMAPVPAPVMMPSPPARVPNPQWPRTLFDRLDGRGP